MLAPIRLPGLLARISDLRDKGAIDDIRVIEKDDNAYDEYSSTKYAPEQWETHIALGAPYFSYNLVGGHRPTASFPVLYGNVISGLSNIFPPRRLTKVEHSITDRHHFVLQQISYSEGLGVVFEDDVVIKRESPSPARLLAGIARITKPYYFDLCDTTIHLPELGKKLQIAGHSSRSLKHAFVRTLQTYALSQGTAKMLMNANIPYSLPADMHLQIIADKIGLPGLSFYESGFLHGSKVGLFSSTTDLHKKSL